MLIFKVYPDGTVTSGSIRKFNPPPPIPQYEDPEADFWANAVAVHGVEAALDARRPLGLSTLPNSQIPETKDSSQGQRLPRGGKGITSHGRRLVRAACRFLEDSVQRNRLSFLTATLPTGISDLTREEWTEAVRQMQQQVKNDLIRAGLPGHIVGVTEVQELRQSREGGLPLHIHWTFEGRRPKSAWAIGCERFEELWKNAIENATKNRIENRIENVEWNASVNVQRVKKSLVGYLGKYMTKGLKMVRELTDQGLGHSLPATWYVCCNHFRTIYKKNLYILTGPLAEAAMDLLTGELAPALKWSRFVEIEDSQGFLMKVGWVGRVMDDLHPDAFYALLMANL